MVVRSICSFNRSMPLMREDVWRVVERHGLVDRVVPPRFPETPVRHHESRIHDFNSYLAQDYNKRTHAFNSYLAHDHNKRTEPPLGSGWENIGSLSIPKSPEKSDSTSEPSLRSGWENIGSLSIPKSPEKSESTLKPSFGSAFGTVDRSSSKSPGKPQPAPEPSTFASSAFGDPSRNRPEETQIGSPSRDPAEAASQAPSVPKDTDSKDFSIKTESGVSDDLKDSQQ